MRKKDVMALVEQEARVAKQLVYHEEHKILNNERRIEVLEQKLDALMGYLKIAFVYQPKRTDITEEHYTIQSVDREIVKGSSNND